MSDIIKRKFMSLAEVLHLKIFGHEMSDEMREFLGHLSWSFFGGVFAGGILLLANILAGRWLGPEEYGKYNLVLAISSFLIIFMTFGLDTAAPRFIALLGEKSEKKSLTRFILKRAFVSTLIVFVLALAALFLLKEKELFDFEVFLFAVVFALFLSIRNTADSILRGMELFRFQSMARLIEGVFVLVIFIGLYYFFEQSFGIYVFATSIGYFVFGILALARSKFFSAPISIISVQRNQAVVQYGMYAIIGAFASFLFMGSDKIFVNSFLNKENLGLYSAYFTIAVMPMTLLQSIVVNVFFPLVSNSFDKLAILKKINRLFSIFFIPATFLIFISSYVLITLFGEAYRRDILLIMLFSFYASLFFFIGIKQWFLASLSDSSILYSSIAAIIAGLTQLIITFVLLNNGFGLHALISGIIIAYIVFMFLNQYFISVNIKKYET